MPSHRTQRLDLLLVSRGMADSRAKAQALVMAGRVTSRGVRLEKSGSRLDVDVPLEVIPAPRHVSRGAAKLAGALSALGVDVCDKLALDVGASTGGFTQVLLEAGSGRVCALDVGHGQLDWRIRNDPRVIVVEGVNARYLRPLDLPFVPSLAVIDVSFISLELVLPGVMSCIEPGGEIVALVKPQFEVGRGKVGPGGIVRDREQHRQVLRRIARFVRYRGRGVLGVVRSPVPGAEGNVEFFVHVSTPARGLGSEEIDRIIDAVVSEEQPA